MRRGRGASIILCLALIMALFTILLPAYAEPAPGETMTVHFELRDATTREYIPITNAIFDLQDQGGIQIPVYEGDSDRGSADLLVGETYRLTVSLGDGYYDANERFTVQADRNHIEILMIPEGSFEIVPSNAVSAMVLGEQGSLEVDVAIAGEKLGEFSADYFSVLLIDDNTYGIERDGLPVGMWDAPPERLHQTRRQSDVPPGEYTLFVAFFQEVGGEHGNYRVLCGYTTRLLEVAEPGYNKMHVVIVAESRSDSSRIPEAQVSVLGGEVPMDGTTDACGRCAFTVEKGPNYGIKISKSDYYAFNEVFAFDSHGREHYVSLYSVGDLVVVPQEAISTEVHEHGHPGVDVTIDPEAPEFPSGFVFDEFAVLALKDRTDWDVEKDGIPGELRNARRGRLGDTVDLNMEQGDQGDYVLFVVFYGKGGDDDLIGFAVTSVEITAVSGSHDPVPTEVLEIHWKSTDPDDEETFLVNWSPGWDCIVNIPASESGTIEFPSEIGERSLSLEGLDAPPWAEFSLESFGGSIEDNTLSYTSSFGRIVLIFQEGDSSECRVVLVQPECEAAVLEFELHRADGTAGGTKIETFTMENDGSWEQRHRAFELPFDLASGYIEAVAAGGGVSDLDGGIWEYLVDRSEYACSRPGEPLYLKRYFGKVTMHYQYQIGYSWGDAMVTFYEPDYVGIQVRPQIGAGDWHTGITNASQAALGMGTPTAFVYFLNTQVHISPEGIGMPVAITGVSSEEEGVTATFERQYDTEGWTVTLPDLMEPVTRLELELEFEDGNKTIVPLDVKRVLLDAFTSEYPEPSESGDTLFTPRGTEYEYKGEKFTTFVGVFAYTEDPEDLDFFEVDHTLLVNYYCDDVLLGTRQFPAETEHREEIIVYRQGVAEYADLASANRVTAFLITKEGVKADDDTFGGAVFGVGAGWGHLMPNHEDYGTGKDGMQYE